jgi:RNA polymerase sigma factor (sigma-70 family)
MASGQLDVVLRHIHQLAGTPSAEAVRDGQLLQRFAEAGEEAAFAALVRRHGPMVLGVCRRVLRDVHEAEDAFQATFLVLLRRSRALDRRGSLAGWLHAVAYHVALRARAQAARRQRQERQVAEMANAVSAPGEVWLDLQPVLDEELSRLPDSYRDVVLLCGVQGKTNAEAARLLGWAVGTVKGRLSRARDLLRKRLARRGISLSVGALSLLLAENAVAALPATLVHATAQTALAAAAGAGSTPALSLAEGVLKTMFVSKLKLATAFLLLVSLVALGAGALARPAQTVLPSPTVPPPAAHARTPDTVKPRPATRPQASKESAQEVTLTGRVLGADGRPLAGASVTVLRPSPTAAPSRLVGDFDGDGMVAYFAGRYVPPTGPAEVLGQAMTDRQGQFRLKVQASPGSRQLVVAAASGHGPAWGLCDKAGTVELRLLAERVVRGRLVDVQGQPAAGVKLQVSRLGERSPASTGKGYRTIKFDYFTEALDEFSGGADADIWLDLGSAAGDFYIADDIVYRARIKTRAAAPPLQDTSLTAAPTALVSPRLAVRLPFWPKAVTTDAQGRFELHGVGQGQDVGLRVNDPRYAVQALDLPAKANPKAAAGPLVLQPARHLEGTITDAVTGRPVAGARLRVAPPSAFAFADLGTFGPAPDWRGRRMSRGGGLIAVDLDFRGRVDVGLMSELPAIEGQADAQGHFKLPLYQGASYTLQIAGPAGGRYLPRSVSVTWPAGGVVRKQVDFTLVAAVPVRGKVTDDSGKPVAGARVDCWSKGLKLPEGVRFPHAVKTGADGTFEVLLPPGRWDLLVSAARADYVFTKIEAGKLLDKNTAGPRTFYPDAVQGLDVKSGVAAHEFAVILHRAPVFRGRVVGPDGQAVSAPVSIVYGGPHVLEADSKDGAFAIPLNDPGAEYRVHYLVPARNLGAVLTVASKRAGAAPATVRLAPLGAAQMRFVDATGKPVKNYRPVVWLVSGPDMARDLKQLNEASRQAADSLWLNRLYTGNYYVAGPRTDAEGRVTLRNLIPGATYLIVYQGGRRGRDFTVAAGQTVMLADLVIAP